MFERGLYVFWPQIGILCNNLIDSVPVLTQPGNRFHWKS